MMDHALAKEVVETTIRSIVLKASRDADRIIALLDAAGVPKHENPYAENPEQYKPSPAIVTALEGLSATLEFADLECIGLKDQLYPKLPSSQVMFEETLRALRGQPNQCSDISAQAFAAWLNFDDSAFTAIFGVPGYSLSNDNQDAVLDALADFLYTNRHLADSQFIGATHDAQNN
jgi:hypothetical protein